MINNAVFAKTLKVAVAANFYPTLKIIAKEFKQETKHDLILSPASSGKHFAQIVNGASFDVFLSADKEMPQKLIQLGKAVESSRMTYAIGQLALAGQCQLTQELELCLKENKFQTLALANSEFAPYGKAALEVLRFLGIEESSKGKWRVGLNVNQAFQYVKTQNVELGLVALSLVKQAKLNERNYRIVPYDYYFPIYQDAIILEKSNNKQLAKLFLEFLKQDRIKLIINNSGYRLIEVNEKERYLSKNSEELADVF
ncbi:MAG: molybdate ABC transporter substrate-binding protein [Gammaproteobacteria bacterium]|nr:molybdate ABC transporter substrate-binding protein [Gammaproteobacteria bacterium]